MSAPAIAPLPCVGALRGGVAIAGLAQAVEECVCNSLDAGASEVHVELDAAALSFRVADDGAGIPQASLAALGSRGATSKLPGAATLGFHGEALAALVECAVVEVTSRAAGSFETYTKVLSGGGTARLGLALEQRVQRGTVVHVRDLFHNAPVRRKALLSAG